MRFLLGSIILWSVLLFPLHITPGFAEAIFQWSDKNGAKYYSNIRPPGDNESTQIIASYQAQIQSDIAPKIAPIQVVSVSLPQIKNIQTEIDKSIQIEYLSKCIKQQNNDLQLLKAIIRKNPNNESFRTSYLSKRNYLNRNLEALKFLEQ